MLKDTILVVNSNLIMYFRFVSCYLVILCPFYSFTNLYAVIVVANMQVNPEGLLIKATMHLC